MDELVRFLRHAQAHVRQQAAAHVHQLSSSPDGLSALKSCDDLVPALARLTGDLQSIAQSSLSALINLAEVPELVESFEQCSIVSRLAENLSQEGYALLQLDVILLANLTARSDKIVDDLLAVRGGSTLLSLVSALRDDVKGEHESLDCVTNIVTNVARLQPGRLFLQNKDSGLIKGLLEQIYSPEKLRRRGMLLFLSNLLFHRDLIAYLTSPGLDYANRLLTLLTASDSVIREPSADEDAICTAQATLCTLGANVRGKIELARIKTLERVKGISVLEMPEGKCRQGLQDLLDILENRKVATQPGGYADGSAAAAAAEGSIVALDREKMAADGVSFVDGQLMQQQTRPLPAAEEGGGGAAADSGGAASLPAAVEGGDDHDDDDDDDDDEVMGMD
jgi:hypothetical protein